MSRLWLADGSTAIRKEAFGPRAAARVRHEASVLERLAGLPGVPQLAGASQPGSVLVADEGGLPLGALLPDGPFEPAEAIRIGLRLAEILAGVHGRGVVHRDVNPHNILLAGPDRRPVLVDFDLATTFAGERPGFAHPSEVAGTLPYLAPEQTGRTGLSVDHRADLYALGAVLYELVSGEPPFGDGGGDDLRLIHDVLVAVPAPLVSVRPGTPPMLSAIVERLLAKEPGRRYQSGTGLARDLALLDRDPGGSFEPGEWDFPLRLAAPSRLIGRDTESAVLLAAFEGALAGGPYGVLVAGGPGVGKSTLVNALRREVAARGGWYVAGKCDQIRSDAAAGAVLQALRGTGRLLLAEPEADLAAHRQRLLAALGPAAAQLAAALPEFAVLLGFAGLPGFTELPGTAGPPGSAGLPDTGGGPEPVADDDPINAAARVRQGVVDVLSAVVSADHPMVLAVDDLQWADPATLGLVDAILTAGGPPGLLLVGAYREGELDPVHPLAAMLERWAGLGAIRPVLRLANLPPAELGTMLAEMLRLPAAQAAALAGAVRGWTAGNPYDTVELVNTLRNEQVLTLTERGWRWDAEAIRRYAGRGDVLDLLRERIAALPPDAARLLALTACLGGTVRADLLASAADRPVAAVHQLLAPALEDGLLLLDRAAGRAVSAAGSAEDLLRFRHDRVQQAAYAAAGRAELHLALARRLAAVPGREVEAAGQYLAADPVTGAGERHRVVRLYRAAAANARRISNYATAERYLTAAVGLLAGTGGAQPEPAGLAELTELEIERHAALYTLGRLVEADMSYGVVAGRCADPVQLAAAACVQVNSLTQRGRAPAALELGLSVLRQLGWPVPADVDAGLAGGLAEVAGWAARLDLAADLARPESADPRVRAVGRLFNRMLPAAFFAGNPAITAWIVFECVRMWVDHGPSPELVANLSCVGLVAVPHLHDHRVGHRVGTHLLALAQERDYEPATSLLRHRHSLHVMPWIEPLERATSQARLAREGLLRGGDLQMASHTYLSVLAGQLECGRSLEAYAAEAEAALALATRTGNQHNAQAAAVHRELAQTLRGASAVPGTAPDLSGNPLATGLRHLYQALAAAVFGDAAGLLEHGAQAQAARRFVPGYPAALVVLLRALGLATQLRHRGAELGRASGIDLLADLDGCRDWLAERAADAPDNFGHLVRFVDAERAWAVGDYRAAAQAFDQAAEQAAGVSRPWHLAMITEHAGNLHCAHGIARTGGRLLGEAMGLYADWGAHAKVRQLEHAHPELRGAAAGAPAGGGAAAGAPAARHSSGVNVDAIDMLAILRASQALSSQTSVAGLREAIVEQLTTLTGATDVLLALRNDDTQEWFLPAGGSGEPIPVEEAGRRGLLPVTAFWYAERTREPLLVADATTDDRFARDRYVAALDRCALLAAPILNQGSVRAMLLLANDQRSGAFSTDRLDAVMLIAGQLSVSLGNALLYGSLEERVAERTEALAEANRQLEVLSVTDALTGLANRRRFTQVLEAEWGRAQRTGKPVGIVMVDVDFFKRFNDCYGHPEGDECLRLVALTLERSSRGSDLVCRYGGEEFAVILPGADPTGVLVSAERARAAVAELAVPHETSECGTVTISAGAASVVPAPDRAADDLLALADAALYQAKAAGRNQVRGAPD